MHFSAATKMPVTPVGKGRWCFTVTRGADAREKGQPFRAMAERKEEPERPR